MNLDYKELLDKAYNELSKKETKEERFKIPELISIIQGKKTIIKNFMLVAKTLKRDPKQIIKFFVKETGVPANLDGQQLILTGSFNSYRISQMYKKYIAGFVICKQCGKPDTKLISEHGVTVLKCEACGAINAVKKI